MAIYEIKQFRGGLSDYEDKGIPGAFKFGSNLDIRKQIDSLSAQNCLVDEGLIGVASYSKSPSTSASPSGSGSPSESKSGSASPSATASISSSASLSSSKSASPSGSLSQSKSESPSPSPSAGLTTVFSDLVLWFVKCSDGNTYGFGNTGKIYKRVPSRSWTQVANIGERIRGAIEKPSSSGKTYLLFATNTDLHIKEIPGSSDWNDIDGVAGWPKHNLTSTDWHTMIQVGGAAYICNKSSLALVGYDDSYTNNALDLIPGNIAKTLVERNGRVIIGCVDAGDPDRGVNGAIDCEVPIAQVGKDGDIYFANMTDSISVKRFPGEGSIYPGGIANEVQILSFFEWEQDSLSWIDKQSIGNMALMGVFDADSGRGGIYTYGRKNKNHPLVLNLDYLLDVDEIGAVACVDGIPIASYRDGTSFGVKGVDLTQRQQAIYEGLDFKAPVKHPSSITTWKYAELYMSPLPTGSSVEFHYKLNKTGGWHQATCADGTTRFEYATGKKAVFRIGEEAEIFEPRIVINPYENNTPEIYRVRVYFD